MQNVKNADADMKRFGNIALIYFTVAITFLNDDNGFNWQYMISFYLQVFRREEERSSTSLGSHTNS